jgi:D-alanyl-D-alanine endopeptidase (penicillin-binding protein 7)
LNDVPSLLKRISLSSIIACALVFLLQGSFFAHGQEYDPYEQKSFSVHLDAATIAKGYTVDAYDGALKLSLIQGILSESTEVAIEHIDTMEMPWRLERVSPIFQFEFLNKHAYQRNHPFYIQIKTEKETNQLKQVFFYDKTYGTWRPLPTRDFPGESYVRSLIHVPYARIAVFAYPNVLGYGDSSWYAHKPGNYAASPDFPKGSVVRVHNLENEKFVDVTINDFGPNRLIFPNRVIDLEKQAFSALAPLSSGIIRVKIEPLRIATTNGNMTGIDDRGMAATPSIGSKAAFAFNPENGMVLFEKNANQPLPIASLSKLIATRTYLDTLPTLSRVVTYQIQDEKLNYRYVDHPWEVARLAVKDGETMTEEDLLYSALVGSANNAVESLVRVSGISRKEFLARMNSFAMQYDLSTVHFDDPTGLSPKNVASAREFANLAHKALAHSLIQKASTMDRYSFVTINTKKKHTIKNTDKLLAVEPFQFIGSKTGYLHEAGYCLFVSIQTSHGPVIAVTLGDKNRASSSENMKSLLYFSVHKLSQEHDKTVTL